MKTINRFIIAAAALAAGTTAADACTSFLVGKKASADGSAMISYAADSHNLYGDITHTPAADHKPGETREVRDWDTNRYLCHIPQPAHTYAVTGNMNEHGLAIGESTWGGREELEGDKGIDYGSLIYIALERSRTAREAIDVMTSLVAEHGYASSGESFSISDGNEVWLMELIGKGKEEKGAVWVARRIPDDCIAAHANHSRIHQFPLDEPETTLYSPDVIEFARRRGFYEGPDSLFSFSRAYAVTDQSATRGCDGRVYSFFRRHTSPEAMDVYLPWVLRAEGNPMPLWVKPSAALTVDMVKDDMRDHFEGTVLDMTQDIGAGAYKVPYRWRPLTYKVDGNTYTHERATATQQTGFSFVAQLDRNAPKGMKGILWFGVDDTNTCVYVPIYASSATVPHEFARGNGDMLTLSWDAAFWVTNYVANQAYNRYSLMIPDIRRVQQAEEGKISQEVEQLRAEVASLGDAEAARRLEAHSAEAAARYVKNYKALGDYLLVKYLDGNVKKTDENGEFVRTPDGICAYPEFPGYDDGYYRTIVNSTGEKFKVEE